MDPFTLASAFAQIVSLLATYKGERTSREQGTAQDFLIWLEKNNHRELKGMLEAHAESLQGIHSLLSEQQGAFLSRLQSIDKLLAQIAGHVEGFGAIAHAVRPGVELSEQAVGILRQFNESGAARCLEVVTNESLSYIFMDHAGGQIGYDDVQFIRDDFATLVDIGFMRQEFNSRGSPIYVITRPGSQYAKLLSPQAPA